ncbi:MAG: cysteine desulfurase [Acidimicrobiia bacterium]|nr:cysteine desulfurase [Acidimicrobiia bacterium]MDH5615189.1 cysteine desulfurase [Acidimicrobiia bacterium]
MDFSHLRQDFPVLQRRIHGKPLVFLDSAASSQKPTQVLDVMDAVYRTYYANVHRGAYLLSEESTTAYEEARGKVARFINAGSRSEVVFTRGATTALNMVAFGWGMDHLSAGDKIMLTMMEHHANMVPWQLVARRTGAELVYLPMTGDYRLDVDRIPELLDERVKVVSFTGMSNVTGTMPPVAEIAKVARDHGALVVVDAAQLVTHAPVDVQELGADFVAFSGHKMLGPTGIGALWGRPSLLEEMEPFEGGGEMISDVQLNGSTWAPVPHKFEAGTPPIVEAIGLGAAVDYLEKIGMELVRRHEQELTGYALDRLAELPAVRVFGPADLEHRGGVISFALGDVHPHDVATILDQEGIAVRAGHHCAKPLTRALGVPATVRASFQVYNTRQDVDALFAGLRRAEEVFRVD